MPEVEISYLHSICCKLDKSTGLSDPDSRFLVVAQSLFRQQNQLCNGRNRSEITNPWPRTHIYLANSELLGSPDRLELLSKTELSQLSASAIINERRPRTLVVIVPLRKEAFVFIFSINVRHTQAVGGVLNRLQKTSHNKVFRLRQHYYAVGEQ